MALRLAVRPLASLTGANGKLGLLSATVRRWTQTQAAKKEAVEEVGFFSAKNRAYIDCIYATQLQSDLEQEAIKERLGERYNATMTLLDCELDDFPYYLNPTVLEQLDAFGNLHLQNHAMASQLATACSTACGVVLLRCMRQDMELYQERLARVLARRFHAGLLAIDLTDFVKVKVAGPTRASRRRDNPVISVSGPFGAMSFPQIQLRQVAGGVEMQPMDGQSSPEETAQLQATLRAIFDTVSSKVHKEPSIVYFRDFLDVFDTEGKRQLLAAEVAKIHKNKGLLVVGSSSPKDEKKRAGHGLLIQRLIGGDDDGDEEGSTDMADVEGVANVWIPEPPPDVDREGWHQQLTADNFIVIQRDNHRSIARILKQALIAHDSLSGVAGLDQRVLSMGEAETLVMWAVGGGLPVKAGPRGKAGVMVHATAGKSGNHLYLTAASLTEAVKLLGRRASLDTGNEGVKKTYPGIVDMTKLNSNEKRLLGNLVSPGSIGVGFGDIGALDYCKELLQEVISLPLHRPQLFAKGLLAKCPTGVLLFGPPGTGKTMLAKAVAKESGSNFLHIGMSDIMNKYVGQSEKNAKAVFTLARKVAPCVIFLDEVDSLFSNRDNDRYTSKREALTELMQEWDGLSLQTGRVLVMAATNRPFDMDEAVIRRLPRRLMVDMPDLEARRQILKLLLANEELEPTVDIEKLAVATAGYTGSDLNNLAMAAANRAVRELLNKEKAEGKQYDTVPPLALRHFEGARGDIKESVNEDSETMTKLHDWNAKYGEGAAKRHRPPIGFRSQGEP